ncbi:imelysin family protein [Oceanicella sp. SM1341]|uniref:imelysin family protein n=1 Tax=Oceanicella sp. SM1341 TaxID=1548889 RepID=UPI000E53F0FA|nr:imelysin family protein [Oceanicella sp. SM1341]
MRSCLGALSLAATLLAPLAAGAQEAAPRAIAERALDQVILPGFGAFEAETAGLEAAARGCDEAAMRSAYQASFDAWEGVSHLRFGPTEEEERAFAIAFWPDRKGFTARNLAGLAEAEDPVVDDPEAFGHVSIAARGLFALDYLLYDETGLTLGAGPYRCRLLQAVSIDLHRLAAALVDRWEDPWSGWLLEAGAADNLAYPEPLSAVQEFYKALLGGVQFTRDLRLGNPLGSFDRPRPTRAEAWRSDRPLRNIRLSLDAAERMTEAVFVPALPPENAEAARAAFARVRDDLSRIAPPLTEAVADPMSRFRVEALQTDYNQLYIALSMAIAPELGVREGFNALDGD